MTSKKSEMDKFDFLIGEWELRYNIPKSTFSKKATGTGRGTFKRALDDKYVFFDYVARVSDEEGEAHGIFAWDDKARIYRYWWFESSGSFMKATCHFVNENTLHMSWHDTVLRQTFTRVSANQVVLRMDHPNAEGEYDLILEVTFTRK